MLGIDSLSRRFGAHAVVSKLDLAVAAGERVALRGPNGSGKTTVLRCVAGTLEPSGGRIRVAGHPAGSVAARRLTGVSLSQERSFYLRLSGRANLRFFARLRGCAAREADQVVRALEEELEITDILQERVDRCSSGMLQQLALARVLLGEPPLLLLDEPTRSLDDAAIARLWRAIDDRPRVAVLIATHHEDDVAHCDRTVRLPS
jgi:ABC-2 type transport system ATP-binding protein